MKDETKCLHAGYSPKNAEPRIVPIVQSTTYVHDSTEEVTAAFDGPMKSLICSRFGNPTIMAAEDKVAQLEGGIDTMYTASGQTAISLSILNVYSADDSLISTTETYGGSVNLFSFTLKKLSVEYIYIDKNASNEEIDKAFQSNTEAVFEETIANLILTVSDIKRFTRVVHKHNALLIIGNTFTTPILCKSFEYGADIVIYSTLEYMDDHTVQIGGCIVGSENSDQTRENFPDLTESDESYHGIPYTKAYGKKAYIVRARMQLMHDFGVYLTTHSVFLLNLGLEALAVRMKQYRGNAMTIVRYLEKSPYVERVIYPGLGSCEGYLLAQKCLKSYSGVISFVTKGGKETAMRFINTLEFTLSEVHMAGIRTCALHPAGETHRQPTDEQLIAAGTESGMIGLLVGLENAEDIITDLDKAFPVIEYRLRVLGK